MGGTVDGCGLRVNVGGFIEIGVLGGIVGDYGLEAVYGFTEVRVLGGIVGGFIVGGNTGGLRR